MLSPVEAGETIGAVDATTGREAAIVNSIAKRLLDVVGALVALVLLTPLLAVLTILIILDSGWPPLYVHTRVGLRGAPFSMWKFRTMVRNADDLRSALEHRNEASFPAFKIRQDPRVTRLGRLLRRSSFDELPQLVNVVLGQMSLVGPRPPLPSEVDRYDSRAWLRLTVRPGLTCYWQVENRSRSISFEEWVNLDVRYIDNWSVILDVRLLLKTVGAVARMTGE